MGKHIEMDASTEARVRRGEVVCKTEPVPGYPTPRLTVHAVIDRPVQLGVVRRGEWVELDVAPGEYVQPLK